MPDACHRRPLPWSVPGSAGRALLRRRDVYDLDSRYQRLVCRSPLPTEGSDVNLASIVANQTTLERQSGDPGVAGTLPQTLLCDPAVREVGLQSKRGMSNRPHLRDPGA